MGWPIKKFLSFALLLVIMFPTLVSARTGTSEALDKPTEIPQSVVDTTEPITSGEYNKASDDLSVIETDAGALWLLGKAKIIPVFNDSDKNISTCTGVKSASSLGLKRISYNSIIVSSKYFLSEGSAYIDGFNGNKVFKAIRGNLEFPLVYVVSDCSQAKGLSSKVVGFSKLSLKEDEEGKHAYTNFIKDIGMTETNFVDAWKDVVSSSYDRPVISATEVLVIGDGDKKPPAEDLTKEQDTENVASKDVSFFFVADTSVMRVFVDALGYLNNVIFVYMLLLLCTYLLSSPRFVGGPEWIFRICAFNLMSAESVERNGKTIREVTPSFMLYSCGLIFVITIANWSGVLYTVVGFLYEAIFTAIKWIDTQV